MSYSIFVYTPLEQAALQTVVAELARRVERQGMLYDSNYPEVAGYLKPLELIADALSHARLDEAVVARLRQCRTVLEIEDPLVGAESPAERAVLVATLRALPGAVVDDDGHWSLVEAFERRFVGRQGWDDLLRPPRAPRKPKPDRDERRAAAFVSRLREQGWLLLATDATASSLVAELADLDAWWKMGDEALAGWLIDRSGVVELLATDADLRGAADASGGTRRRKGEGCATPEPAPGAVELILEAPFVMTSGSRGTARARLRGGPAAAVVDRVMLSLEVWPEGQEQGPKGRRSRGKPAVDLGAMPGSGARAIGPGEEVVLEAGFEAPRCESLYAKSPERYAGLVIATDDDVHFDWRGDGPLPMISWESATSHLRAVAEVGSARACSATARLHVLPEAAGPMTRAAVSSEGELVERLKAVGAERVFVSDASDTWFAWWAGLGGRTVAYGPIQIVCSVREDGIYLAHDNERIPPPSRFPRQPSEPQATAAGGLAEAFLLARRLVAKAGAGAVLPRPIGNAVAMLPYLELAAEHSTSTPRRAGTSR